MHSSSLLAKLVLAAVLALPLVACRDEAKPPSPHPPVTAPRVQLDERNDYLAGLRREQLDVRSELQRAIDAIDARLLELNATTDRAKVDELVRRRSVLAADVEAVESAAPETWDSVRSRVEKNLTTG